MEFFYLFANPAGTANLSVRDRELSDDVWLVQLRRRKMVVHSFAETLYLSVRDGKLSNAVWLVEFRLRKFAVHTFWGWSRQG